MQDIFYLQLLYLFAKMAQAQINDIYFQDLMK